MTASLLHPFFHPRAVAVVGATRTPGFGYILPLMLRENGWADRTYLVNPRGGELHGYKVLESVAELPPEADLAIVITGAAHVPGALEELGRKGIRNVIVESAGFGETGDEGRALQDKGKEIAAEYGVRVMGPNCVGVINPSNKFSTVEVVPEALIPGNLGIIAQSGAFGNVLLDGLHEKGLYVSKAATLGNRMDINECDVLEFLAGDADTRAIIMYLEGAADGARLKKTLTEVCANKPVLVLKSGRTEAGRQATASHTGSMAGEDEIYDALFAQTGAIRAESLDDLIGLARVFTTQPAPQGNRLAILTTSGSLGALAADEAIKHGLVLPPPSPSIREALGKDAPAWMNVKNPLDVGPSGMFAKALTALMSDPDIDMVLAIAIIPYAVISRFLPSGLSVKTWFGDISSLRANHPGKPLVIASVASSEFLLLLAQASGPQVPIFTSPEQAARMMAKLCHYHR